MHRNVCIIIINIIVKIFFLLFQVIAKCSFSKRVLRNSTLEKFAEEHNEYRRRDANNFTKCKKCITY